ncbi:MAG: metal ABC transporter permease [Anaplasmataceae bacterium]|nr:metal ABC transporter permease [Anaplasmataceae bacterium]
MSLGEILSHPLLLPALLAAIAASIAGGIMGSYIVAKRIVFLSGSISHAVLGGMGFFLWLKRHFHLEWASPLFGALIAALLSALALGWIRFRYKEREDTLIAALWSTGMSIGVIFIALTPGYNVELTNFLFGNILWATPRDVAILIGFDILLITLTRLYHKQFLAICFDEEQALMQGLNVKKLYMFLLCMIAVSIVLLIQVVGAILVVALLAIPPAIAAIFSSRLSKIMILAVFIGIGISFAGISASYRLNWPPGATIALIAAIVYLGSLPYQRHSTT